MANRLANETSPYLLQHAHNPVDWQPWDEAALQEAQHRDAPVLLSIGYAACHWCHVMEHESFSDPVTAEVMNSGFVCIKVDREERPDLDAIYMDAVQAMTGSGGWPMTVFLTPDGRPFYGGTYFPPEDGHGLPGFPKLLGAIRDAWTQRRGEVEAQAGKLAGAINVAARMKPSPESIERHLLERAATALQTSFDDAHGGFGGAPKFPQPMVIDLLLRLAAGGTRGTLDMATQTLDAMASGGMFDQLGGGFHRYSVDDTWTVPHFEKMLYDNALLLRTYTRSHLVTDSARHLEVAEMTAAWMLDEMRDPGGAFYSSLDADSEGEEGLFYVWDLDEVADVTEADFEAAIETWGFTSRGNFEGMNIPVAASQHTGEAARRARDRLLERRSERVRPATDDKLLAAWNGLAAASLAEAGAALDKPEWVAAAGEVMDFVLTQMRVGDRLVRAVRRRGDGSYSTGSPAFCEDYAGVLEACLALFEATGETRWIDESRWAADEALRLFSDPAAGGFFSTGSDAEELVSRPKDIVDNAVPSSNSILALELQRLALVTSQNRYEDAAGGCLALVRDAMERSPFGFAHALCAADFYTSRPLEIVVIGPGADDLLRAIRARFMPTKVLVPGIEGHDAPRLPLLEARTRIGGRPAAYVCTRGACRQPVTTVEDLLSEIEAG